MKVCRKADNKFSPLMEQSSLFIVKNTYSLHTLTLHFYKQT